MAAARRTSAGSTDCSRSSATTTQRKSSSLASLIRAWRRGAVEQRELRPSDPVGIIRDGELGQHRRNGLADAPGIGTEVEQGESQTLTDLEEPVCPVPDLLGLARAPTFFSDHAVQRSEPPVILGEPRRRIEAG